MTSFVSYAVGNEGQIWVTTTEGYVRPATSKEWLNIWILNPAITLRIANAHA